MNKNLLKIGALALGMFAFGMLFTNAQTPATWEVTLSISEWVTACAYGTSLDLGSTGAEILLTTGVTLSNTFGGNFNCSDYRGSTGSWDFTIQTTDLSNGLGNSIDANLVSINHSTGTLQWDSSCTRGSAIGDTRTEIGTVYPIISRWTSTSDLVCEVNVANVALKVDIPAYQAPGSYSGTLTLTLPVWFTTK